MGHSIKSNERSISEIENTGEGLTFKIFPNPGNSYFTLSIQTNNNLDKISVRISDLSGRLVESKNDLIGSQNLRMGNNLNAGVYFIQLRVDEKMDYTLTKSIVYIK